ncbi:benzyl alcohol O-benzoyltransferase-like [Prosopis cineraria]|uniref:benzyl alcohol O-benzoyltransferase-like n=1 Tax=Prosopis cineraria TaxID=364024 RepID=UPI00240F5E2F|nr:benzyl alcohol O-benzoyltransferase-like [Prosopis cineraria]
MTCTHQEYDEVVGNPIPITGTTHRSFFFGATEVSSIRKLLPTHLSHQPTSFDLVTVCLWRCRTKALQADPQDDVRLMFLANARIGRDRFKPPLPKGYYGNAIVFRQRFRRSENSESLLEYALELVRESKDVVNGEYFHSVADFLVTRGRPSFATVRSFIVADFSCLGFKDVDFGWGKAVYAGPAFSGLGTLQGSTFYVGYSNSKGEEGRIVPVCLPPECMEKFAKEFGSYA